MFNHSQKGKAVNWPLSSSVATTSASGIFDPSIYMVVDCVNSIAF